MKLRLGRNEDNCLTCPLSVTTYEWAENDGPDGEHREVASETCGAILHIDYAGTLGLDAIEGRGLVELFDGKPDAGGWTVGCENGHTLAMCDGNQTDLDTSIDLDWLGFEIPPMHERFHACPGCGFAILKRFDRCASCRFDRRDAAVSLRREAL